eukprot:scaffold21273_cov61-Phaeocystis_antarctica.AAC.2
MRSQVHLVSPHRVVLAGDMEVALRYVCRLQQPPGLSELGTQPREALGPEHAPQRVGRVDRAVDDEVAHVHAARTQLVCEALAEHPPPAHGRRVRVLALVAAHGGRRRGHEQRAAAALDHAWRHGLGEAEQPLATQPPTHLKGLARGGLERHVA